MSGPEVIVVGAGVVGAACAEALAEGGCSVTVFESAFPGAGATGAAMGHVVVMDDSDAQLAFTAFSRRLWTERATSLPPEVEDRACGTLWVAANDAEMRLLRAKADLYTARGEAVELLDERGVRDAEPLLREGLAGGLRVSADRVVYPPAAARVLLESARRRGAHVHQGTHVEMVAAGRARIDGAWVEADVLVLAAGVDSPRLVPGLPVVPRKGHLVITDRYPGLVRHQTIETGYVASAHALGDCSVAFNVQPRATGQLLVGSSRELVGFEPSVNHALCARMLRRATSFMPALAGLQAIRTWVGFRPATADHLPLLGRWEDRLFVAAGHEGLGVTTSLGTACLLRDLVLGRPPDLDPSPFDPRRSMPARG
jgi:glycine/D-amino acid oxidase-like deaminating enzyme